MEIAVRLLSSIAATALIPFVLLRGLFDSRWRKTLLERFGQGVWSTSIWSEREVIWFHGASVGEITGLSPAIFEIRKRFPGLLTLVTTTSYSGREEVKRRRLADKAIVFPFDHPLVVRKVLAAVRPQLIVLAETELWPNFLFAAKDLQIPVLVVNGRMSEYSFPQYFRFRLLFRPLLRSMRRILVQTPADAERYRAVGALEDQLAICGSTKYSLQLETLSASERGAFATEIGIDTERPCFVAGSVRSGEDEIVIRAYAAAKAKVPTLQMIIAPRHPERFERVARVLYTHGIAFSRRSGLGVHGETSEASDVVLLDSLGELQRVYALASFSFVGGSLVDIGGHNPFEPASCRSCVLIGPYRSNVKDMADELEAKGGLFLVRNEDELASTITRLAENPDECLARGARAYEVWRRNSRALEKVMPEIEAFLLAEPEDELVEGTAIQGV